MIKIIFTLFIIFISLIKIPAIANGYGPKDLEKIFTHKILQKIRNNEIQPEELKSRIELATSEIEKRKNGECSNSIKNRSNRPDSCQEMTIKLYNHKLTSIRSLTNQFEDDLINKYADKWDKPIYKRKNGYCEDQGLKYYQSRRMDDNYNITETDLCISAEEFQEIKKQEEELTKAADEQTEELDSWYGVDDISNSGLDLYEKELKDRQSKRPKKQKKCIKSGMIYITKTRNGNKLCLTKKESQEHERLYGPYKKELDGYAEYFKNKQIADDIATCVIKCGKVVSFCTTGHTTMITTQLCGKVAHINNSNSSAGCKAYCNSN